MNYVKLIGGLGNQLFQYAYAYNLFKKGKAVKLESSEFFYYDLHKLKIQNYKIILKFSNWKEVRKFYIFNNLHLSYRIKLISKKIYIFLNKILNNYPTIYENSKNFNLNRKNILHDGHWQDLKIVELHKKELLKQINLKKYTKSHKKLINKISKRKNSVAIHVRLYTKIRREDMHHGNISSNYIKKAKKIIEKKVNKPFYFIFTNSHEWVIKNLKLKGSNFMIVNGFEDYEDLLSISKCKHQIISNSTFGWWGAWLNNYKKKNVIFPKNWFRLKENPQNLFPKNWTKI